jgi:hypothetical protein
VDEEAELEEAELEEAELEEEEVVAEVTVVVVVETTVEELGTDSTEDESRVPLLENALEVTLPQAASIKAKAPKRRANGLRNEKDFMDEVPAVIILNRPSIIRYQKPSVQ